MIIAIGCDHGGFPLKETALLVVMKAGHEILDLGTFTADPVDYPDYAKAIGEAIQQGKADRGILICGSGVGACVAANKMKNVRAGVCHDTYSAHQAVEHDDINVLCLGARIIGIELAKEIIAAFLNAKFTNEERHVRRVGKVKEMENGNKQNQRA
ncbi:MAG: ribose 5-phosphate isomerase B [Chloroflexota bacterium]